MLNVSIYFFMLEYYKYLYFSELQNVPPVDVDFQSFI